MFLSSGRPKRGALEVTGARAAAALPPACPLARAAAAACSLSPYREPSRSRAVSAKHTHTPEAYSSLWKGFQHDFCFSSKRPDHCGPCLSDVKAESFIVHGAALENNLEAAMSAECHVLGGYWS